MSRLAAIVGLLAAVTLAGCAGSLQPGVDDTADVRFAAPADAVKSALADVLIEQGYSVKVGDTNLRTGYRDETGGIWDWMLTSRLGVGRSRVEALVVPEDASVTRVTVLVRYEAKKWMWDLWRTAPPPVAQSAVNQVRLLRNRLAVPDPQFISEESSPSSSPNRSAIR